MVASAILDWAELKCAPPVLLCSKQTADPIQQSAKQKLQYSAGTVWVIHQTASDIWGDCCRLHTPTVQHLVHTLAINPPLCAANSWSEKCCLMSFFLLLFHEGFSFIYSQIKSAESSAIKETDVLLNSRMPLRFWRSLRSRKHKTHKPSDPRHHNNNHLPVIATYTSHLLLLHPQAQLAASH